MDGWQPYRVDNVWQMGRKFRLETIGNQMRQARPRNCLWIDIG